MTVITVPLSTVRPNGQFFQQVSEAVNFRGGSIEYNGDTATVTLQDIEFFDLIEFNKVIDANGEVEYYPLKCKLDKNTYLYGLIPQSILEILQLDKNKEYIWQDVFKFSQDIFDDNANIYMVLSTNNEWLKGSVAKAVTDKLNVQLEQA